MKLKSEIINIDTQSIKLPCLMISEDDDVYLFTKETNGKHSPVIYSKNNPNTEGINYTSRNILEDDGFDILKLTPFLGIIKLQMKN